MIELRFAQFLTEAPFSSPGMLPPGPPPGGPGMGGPMPPMGGGMGMGAMPPPPMGGPGMGGPMGPPGMGGPQQQQPKGPTELKSTDVWKVLEELLGLAKEEKPKNKPSEQPRNMVNSRSNSHLMT